MFKYEGIIRNIILNYKFNEKPYLYKSFVNFFNKYQKRYLQFNFYDIIIPIPISKKRLKQRGYNQSYLLAKEIANTLNIRLETQLLVKVKDNIAQSTLSKIERIQNTTGVYKTLNNERIINKNILLIDDIYTTGSTAEECCKILKLAGANNIDIFTIAKD